MCLVEVEENSCNYVMQSSMLMLIFVSKIEVHSKNTLTHKSMWNSDLYVISITPSTNQ